MPSVRDTVGGPTGALLKGVHVVAAGKSSAAGVIAFVRQSPKGFGSPFIIEFDTEIVPGIYQWPVNITQARKLADRIGDETETWHGWGIRLKVVKQNNPSTGHIVDSLEVTDIVSPEHVQKIRKSVPGKRAAISDDEEVPF